MTIGEKIKFYRELKGYNQSEFARISGVPLPTLKVYEKSKKISKIEPLMKISEALEISPNVFLEPQFDTIGDISAIFFALSNYTDIEFHGKKKNGKYVANDISFSFASPLLQEFLADWASSVESAKELRRQAKTFKEESVQKPMLESAETLERTLEYSKVSCKVKI